MIRQLHPDDRAARVFNHCASPPDLMSAADAGPPKQATQPSKTVPILSNRSLTVAALKAHPSRDREGAVGRPERRSCLISLAPSIRQRRIAVENDLTGRQSGLQFLSPFPSSEVVNVQRLRLAIVFNTCALLSVMPVESMLSSRIRGRVPSGPRPLSSTAV